ISTNQLVGSGILRFWSSTARLRILRWSNGAGEVWFDAMPLEEPATEKREFQDIVSVQLGCENSHSWEKRSHDLKSYQKRVPLHAVQELKPWQTEPWGGHSVW